MDSTEQRSALRARYTAATDRPSLTSSTASAPTMTRSSWPATVSSLPSGSAWTEPPSWLVISWLRSASEAGTGMMSWPTSLMLSSAADRRRCYGRCPSTSRSWPASSKATHSPSGGRIDIRTGEVWPQAAIEYALETGEEDDDDADDPERWLPVPGEGSREGYRDMELFIASVEDPGRAERLTHRDHRPRRVSPRSRTSSPAGPASSSDGTPCPRSASAAEPDHGSPRPATACCPPTSTIRVCPRDQHPRSGSPLPKGRVAGDRSHGARRVAPVRQPRGSKDRPTPRAGSGADQSDHPRTLRHTCAIHLLASGADPQSATRDGWSRRPRHCAAMHQSAASRLTDARRER